MNAKQIKESNNLKHEPGIFNSRELAFSSLKHYVKSHRVILGENEKYWVVCPADAARLEKNGYEYAE